MNICLGVKKGTRATYYSQIRRYCSWAAAAELDPEKPDRESFLRYLEHLDLSNTSLSVVEKVRAAMFFWTRLLGIEEVLWTDQVPILYKTDSSLALISAHNLYSSCIQFEINDLY